jgi:hypothetical protein
MTVKHERIGHEVEREETERLSADDRAAARADELLADALVEHQLKAARVAAMHRTGWCTNCGERCQLPLVYCDVDCRADHERRLRAGERG